MSAERLLEISREINEHDVAIFDLESEREELLREKRFSGKPLMECQDGETGGNDVG